MGGGGPSGSSGTGTGSIANVYTPMAQPAADVAYNQILQSMIDAGGGLAAQYQPAVSNLASQAVAQPYLGEALTGAQTAATMAGPTSNLAYYGGQDVGNAALTNLPYQQTALGYGFDPAFNQIVQQTADNPYFNQAMAGAQQAAGIGGAGAGQIASGAGNILSTAFDPQQALYNRMRGEALDTQNVINAATGTAGSPYAAGVTGDVLANQAMNWQNQQLARQQAGLGAATSAFPAATQLAAGAAGLPSNVFTQNLAQQLQALQARNQAAGQGAATGNALLQGVGAGLTTGTGLGAQAGNLLAQAYGLPQNVQNQAINQTLGQLGQAFQLSNAPYILPQQTLQDLQSYLGLGQSASQLSGLLGGMGQNQYLQNAALLGSGIGGLNSLTGGGLGSAIGGGLFGSGGATALDAAGNIVPAGSAAAVDFSGTAGPAGFFSAIPAALGS